MFFSDSFSRLCLCCRVFPLNTCSPRLSCCPRPRSATIRSRNTQALIRVVLRASCRASDGDIEFYIELDLHTALFNVLELFSCLINVCAVVYFHFTTFLPLAHCDFHAAPTLSFCNSRLQTHRSAHRSLYPQYFKASWASPSPCCVPLSLQHGPLAALYKQGSCDCQHSQATSHTDFSPLFVFPAATATATASLLN